MERDRYRVLMIGPDRSVHGGISGVVNNYYEAGLDRQIVLCYIGTMVEGAKWRKLVQAAKAYLQFLVRLPRYEMGLCMSIWRQTSAFTGSRCLSKQRLSVGKR